MNRSLININDIIPNKNNPRVIKDDRYKKLVKSIKQFPQMLDIRPIVIDEDNIVLGGNMRLKACKEAGLKEVSVVKVTELSEEQKKEFIIKDNQSFGDWDTKMLSTWDKDMLLDGGFDQWDIIDIFGVNDMGDNYTKAIEGSNFNDEEVNVDDYIKQNILFFNEVMIEFEDDEIKSCIRNIKNISTMPSFINDIKKIIIQYGKNSI